jgi:4'-phosphopantetheinyl transferase
MNVKNAETNPREIRLWWSTLQRADLHLPDLLRFLSIEERSRAERFRVQAAGQRFVAARAMLRLILGRLSGEEPKGLTFIYGDHGKPRLATGLPHFSLTHAGDTIVVAVAAEELGVDVEERRDLANASRLARRICTRRELETLRSAPPQNFSTLLLGLWTAKEAVLKSLGTGISGGMRSVEVDPDFPSTATRKQGEAGTWALLPVSLPVDAVCTVAVRGTGWCLDVTEFAWRPSLESAY